MTKTKTSLIAAGILVALAGCNNSQQGGSQTAGGSTGSGTNTAAGSSGSGGGKTVTIGFSQCTTKEPWRVQMNEDIRTAAAAHAEITLLIKDADDKSENQQAQVRELIQQKVDAIIISPNEARPLTKPVGEAVDAGIPVIVLDRQIEGDKYTCFIGGNNVKIGREAGKFMAKLLGGKGQIVELQGRLTTVPAHDRHNGFMEGLAGAPVTILSNPDCDWKEEKAQREMASALTRYPQIDAVYAHNDPGAHGAWLAAKQEGKGREKTIKFVGIDALPNEGVRYVKEGVLTATFQYPTGGKEAIETALKILAKETVGKKITLGTRIFTKDSVDKGGEPL
jgi:ribose transport system substrate-binding protein